MSSRADSRGERQIAWAFRCTRRDHSEDPSSQRPLALSLYKILQILSVTVFEKTPILEGFSNACSPRTNEVLRREMARVLAGFATFWQFFTRVYTHLHAGQDVWQTDIQGLQQITAGRIRHGDAQAVRPSLKK